ncbi:MAG: right-handed parallel beta-helix repeat-containing protein, partial [Nitrospirae bacterium]|nr:right-handed parallel beta-helix repeat-containing protein [Nitrospirota bacterium]
RPEGAYYQRNWHRDLLWCLYECTLTNVEIKNGTIRYFGSDGIYEESSSGNSHRIINIRVIANKKWGIALYGSNHLIEGCTASFNEQSGIGASYGSTITGNTVYNNGEDGIAAYFGCTITGNTSYNNGSNGIYIEGYSTIKNNTARSNGEYGINCNDSYGNCLIDGNTATSNTSGNLAPHTTSTLHANHAP